MVFFHYDSRKLIDLQSELNLILAQKYKNYFWPLLLIIQKLYTESIL